MTFPHDSLFAAGIATAIAVPTLLLLYFLKLRRQQRVVSSTLLWKRAVHDLRVNAPFQKLRKNLLLFLQMLALLAILFSIANPIVDFLATPDENVVILLDRSASMQTREADGRTRLEHAKEAAITFVESEVGESKAMVISFADHANVDCTFTRDKRQLVRQIQAVQQTDGQTRLGEALQLAVAYSSQLIDDPRSTTPGGAQMIESARIEMFSDGRIADAAEEFVTRGELRLHKIGAAVDNVGITVFDVRREYDDPGVLSVFAVVENFGPEHIKSDVSLTLDGRLLGVQEVSLAPAKGGPAGQDAARQLSFQIPHEGAGVLELKLNREDALAVDNVVHAPIDAPQQVGILIVSDRAAFRKIFSLVFTGMPKDRLDMMTPAEFEDADEDKLRNEGQSAYDLVILDNHDTDRLFPGNYVFFGGIPRAEGFGKGDAVEPQYVAFWKEDHPLIRPAQYQGIYVAGAHRLTLPEHAVALLEAEDSPLMVYVNEPGHNYVIAAFDLLDSNFALQIPFPIFVQNCVRFLPGAVLGESTRLIQPGKTLTVSVPAGAGEVEVRRPDGGEDELDVRTRRSVPYARTDKTGVYTFAFDDPKKTSESFAVNLLDTVESNVIAAGDFKIGQESVAVIEGEAKTNQPLWPYVIAGVLGLLMLEWWVYNRRVMI